MLTIFGGKSTRYLQERALKVILVLEIKLRPTNVEGSFGATRSMYNRITIETNTMPPDSILITKNVKTNTWRFYFRRAYAVETQRLTLRRLTRVGTILISHQHRRRTPSVYNVTRESDVVWHIYIPMKAT